MDSPESWLAPAPSRTMSRFSTTTLARLGGQFASRVETAPLRSSTRRASQSGSDGGRVDGQAGLLPKDNPAAEPEAASPAPGLSVPPSSDQAGETTSPPPQTHSSQWTLMWHQSGARR